MGIRFLLVKPTALGDVAQSSLIVPMIKEMHPDWHVSWVVDSDYAPFVRLCDGVDEVIPFPRKRWKRKFTLKEGVQFACRLARGRYDVVLDLQGLARSALMTWATRAPRRIGLASSREMAFAAYTEIIRDDALHAVDRYRMGLRGAIGTFDFKKVYSLRKPPEPEFKGLIPQKYTVLHPYSMWDTKLWPWERYENLAKKINDECFVLVGSGYFFPLSSKSRIIDLRSKTNISQLVSVLAHARSVISTDSGPAHLAAALGTPCLTLFGATDPKLTAPIGVKTSVICAQIPCMPCLKRECRIEKKMLCMRQMDTEMVKKAWLNLLS